jgi:hypothetical protein
MAKSTYKTVGRIAKAEVANYGVLFRIELLDGSEDAQGQRKRLPYACSIHSNHSSARAFGMARLAELARALGVLVICDTDELLDLECIVEHDGFAINRLRPVRVVEVVTQPRQTFKEWLVSFWSKANG